MGYTHLQPAEPTTLGHRLAVYAQDLLIDRAALAFAGTQMTAKGIRGAVGTSASYTRLLNGGARTAEEQEAEVLGAFELEARDVATQTYPRKLDYLLLSQLAGLGASLSKFAADVRIQSSPGFGEMFEPFGEKQVGSSAMPFKRNPVMAERIDSLARLLPGVCRRRMAERGDQFARADARRQREPAHDPAGSDALHRRDPRRSRERSSTVCASTSARSPKTCAPTARSPAAKRC